MLKATNNNKANIPNKNFLIIILKKEREAIFITYHEYSPKRINLRTYKVYSTYIHIRSYEYTVRAYEIQNTILLQLKSSCFVYSLLLLLSV